MQKSKQEQVTLETNRSFEDDEGVDRGQQSLAQRRALEPLMCSVSALMCSTSPRTGAQRGEVDGAQSPAHDTMGYPANRGLSVKFVGSSYPIRRPFVTAAGPTPCNACIDVL